MVGLALPRSPNINKNERSKVFARTPTLIYKTSQRQFKRDVDYLSHHSGAKSKTGRPANASGHLKTSQAGSNQNQPL